MSDGVLKPEKDFSKDADKLIPEAEQLAKVCEAGSVLVEWRLMVWQTDVQGAVDKLLVLEKQARQVWSFLLLKNASELYLTKFCFRIPTWPLPPDSWWLSSPSAGMPAIGTSSTTKYSFYRRNMGNSSRPRRGWSRWLWGSSIKHLIWM